MNISVTVSPPPDPTIWGRIRHDAVARDGNNLPVYPETVPMQNYPVGTGKGRIIVYPAAWQEFLRVINPAGYNWISGVGTMLFNVGAWKGESINNGGQVVRILEIRDGHVRIEHQQISAVPQDVTYQNEPWLIAKVVCMTRVTMQIANPADGKDIYFPILSNPGDDLWLPLEKVELFRQPPFTISTGQMVLRYIPRGSNVWAMTDAGEIQLTNNTTNLTDWSMDTQPPIPAK